MRFKELYENIIKVAWPICQYLPVTRALFYMTNIV
jgi:hypothetical protein